jgi:methylated-DNA-[protein]-cysteine S-methyltransferase
MQVISGIYEHNLVSFQLFAEIENGICYLTELKLHFDKQSSTPGNPSSGINSDLQRYAQKVLNYLDGNVELFDSVKISMRCITPFQSRILNAAAEIGYGSTLSYKQLAEMCGYTNAARAVGTVMKNNRLPIIIPCHRVIRSDNKTGGYAGKTTGVSSQFKEKLITLEKKGKGIK